MLRYSLAVVLVLCCWSGLARAESQPRLIPGLTLSIAERPTALALHSESAFTEEDKPSSSGTGFIIAGWIASGVGALNLAAMPICFADFYPDNAKDVCVVLSAAFAGIGLGLGIPLLIIGYNKRADYKAWKARNRTLSRLLNLRFGYQHGAALLIYASEL